MAESAPTQVPTKVARLAGIDLARGLAVLGMYAAHVGPEPTEGGIGILFRPVEGRSTALFAVLAGVSIALMSGGRHPKTGVSQVAVGLRLAIRAPLLIALGLLLTEMRTGFLVILAYYGACFLIAIPFLRLRSRALAIVATVVALVMPLVSYAIRSSVAPREMIDLLVDVNLAALTTAPPGEIVLILLLTGTFPAATLMAYVFAGMAIGRLDLADPRTCRRLLGGGASLAVVVYGASWVATDLLGGMQRVYASLAPMAQAAEMTPEEFFEAYKTNVHGTPPTSGLSWQLLTTAHTYTPFDLLACMGVATAIIGGCQLLVRRFAWLLRPLADLGSVILSAYVLHLLVIDMIWVEFHIWFSVWNFLAFSAVAIVAAMAWRRWIGRGPLEWLLNLFSNGPSKLLLRWHRARYG